MPEEDAFQQFMHSFKTNRDPGPNPAAYVKQVKITDEQTLMLLATLHVKRDEANTLRTTLLALTFEEEAIKARIFERLEKTHTEMKGCDRYAFRTWEGSDYYVGWNEE